MEISKIRNALTFSACSSLFDILCRLPSKGPLFCLHTTDNSSVWLSHTCSHISTSHCSGWTHEDDPNDRLCLVDTFLRHLESRNCNVMKYLTPDTIWDRAETIFTNEYELSLDTPWIKTSNINRNNQNVLSEKKETCKYCISTGSWLQIWKNFSWNESPLVR